VVRRRAARARGDRHDLVADRPIACWR
jgi:hypothetical protein